jgi:hypothetical protein
VTVAVLLPQGRLVFPAFGEYIRLHPPFNYIAVTAALYGVAFLVFLHVAGGAASKHCASGLHFKMYA